MKKLLYIDELIITDHFFLSEDDECYYFLEYTSKRDYSFSEGNDLIFNLKKSLKYKGRAPWKYKLDAIQKVAALVKSQVIDKIDLDNATLVPVPPSKAKDHDLYDDRMMQVLQMACKGSKADLRELIVCEDSMEAAHERDVRPTIRELQDNMSIDEDIAEDVADTIYLFDDVLTTGAHFIACKNLLLEEYPEATVIGVFVARRVIEKPDAADFFDDDWEV